MGGVIKKHMRLKLDVMSFSGVMNSYVSKIKNNYKTHKIFCD